MSDSLRSHGHQAPPSMGLSRQEYWSGLPFPSPGNFPTQGSNPGLPHCRQTLYHLSHREAYMHLRGVQLCDPTDGSPLGSSVQGILQARILEWFCHFPPRGELSNPGTEPDLLCLLHFKWILYLLSHQGSPENNLAVS